MHPQLVAVAFAQEGLFTAPQAYAAGYDAVEVRRLVRRGEWAVIRRGVYCLPQALALAAAEPLTAHRLHVIAALLTLGVDTVASHRSAAVLLGLPLLAAPRRLEMTKPSAGWRTGELLVHQRPLAASDVYDGGAVRCTTVARTVLDLGRTLSFAEAVVVADGALRERKVEPCDLCALVDQCSHWPGGLQARRVVAFADGRAEAPSESLARVMFAEQGLPAPEPQAWIRDRLGVIGRVDFLWRSRRTVAEVDGRVKYQARPGEDLHQVLWDEKRREDRLRDAGYEVVRMTWAQIVHQAAQTAARVWAAFGRAERRCAG